MYAKEALDCGLVNKVTEDQESVLGKYSVTHLYYSQFPYMSFISRSHEDS